MTSIVLLVDADNTLWDTNSVFAQAQLALLEHLEVGAKIESADVDRIEFVRRYDQAIASVHHAHLKYPPVLLGIALSLGLEGMKAAEAAEAALHGSARQGTAALKRIHAGIDRYTRLLDGIPALLPTVREGLTLASGASLPVFVVTEGNVDRQRSRLMHHEISALVSGVFETAKTAAQFTRFSLRFAPKRVVMIGDQPDRDIGPARAAGCLAVLVPGKFRPQWQNAATTDPSFVAGTFREAIEWVRKIAD